MSTVLLTEPTPGGVKQQTLQILSILDKGNRSVIVTHKIAFENGTYKAEMCIDTTMTNLRKVDILEAVLLSPLVQRTFLKPQNFQHDAGVNARPSQQQCRESRPLLESTKKNKKICGEANRGIEIPQRGGSRRCNGCAPARPEIVKVSGI